MAKRERSGRLVRQEATSPLMSRSRRGYTGTNSPSVSSGSDTGSPRSCGSITSRWTRAGSRDGEPPSTEGARRRLPRGALWRLTRASGPGFGLPACFRGFSLRLSRRAFRFRLGTGQPSDRICATAGQRNRRLSGTDLGIIQPDDSQLVAQLKCAQADQILRVEGQPKAGRPGEDELGWRSSPPPGAWMI